jgi:hypothetical protein
MEALPPRVRANLSRQLSPGETVTVAATTDYRPNADMPFAWLVITSRQLILCSTHRTRGIYAAYSRSDINDVRQEANGRVLRILSNNQELADLVIPFASTVTSDEAAMLTQAASALLPEQGSTRAQGAS